MKSGRRLLEEHRLSQNAYPTENSALFAFSRIGSHGHFWLQGSLGIQGIEFFRYILESWIHSRPIQNLGFISKRDVENRQ